MRHCGKLEGRLVRFCNRDVRGECIHYGGMYAYRFVDYATGIFGESENASMLKARQGAHDDLERKLKAYYEELRKVGGAIG